MKKILLLLLALTLLTSCTLSQEIEETIALAPELDDAIEETTQAEDEVQKLSNFTLPVMTGTETNPLTCEATVNRALISLLYESLFVVNDKFEAEPVLCESFTVSADLTSYTFKLLPDVKFSDGSPMTNEDVVASISAARSSKYYRGRLARVSYCVAQQDGTVLVQLDSAYENFALMLDVPILKASEVEELQPKGTGPYYLSGNQLLPSKYWWGETPVLDAQRITLKTCQSSDELRDEFQFGDLDMVYCDPNASGSTGYRCDYEIWEMPSTVMQYLSFNTTSGYFAYGELRRAATYAIDRETIVMDCYNSLAQAASLPCSPSSQLYDESLAAQYAYAPEKFAEAADGLGVRTSSLFVGYQGTLLVCNEEPARVKTAELIAQALQDAGLNIVVNAVPMDSFMTALGEKNYDLYLGEVRLTSDFCLRQFFTDSGYLQYGGIASDTLVSMCLAAHENSGNYYDLCQKVMDTGALCPISFKSYAVYVKRGKLTDLAPSVDCVFHSEANARSLYEADRTYAVEDDEVQ